MTHPGGNELLLPGVFYFDRLAGLFSQENTYRLGRFQIDLAAEPPADMRCRNVNFGGIDI